MLGFSEERIHSGGGEKRFSAGSAPQTYLALRKRRRRKLLGTVQVKNIETLNYWLEKEGTALHRQLTDKFGQQVVGFSTLLEEIAWEEA